MIDWRLSGNRWNWMDALAKRRSIEETLVGELRLGVDCGGGKR